MDVLLIQPPSHNHLVDQIFLHEPLALEYIGAGLKPDGHSVALIDARLEPGYEEAVVRLSPDIVGLTGYTSHVRIVLEMAARLKALKPELLIVVGGHHATVKPQDFNIPEIDLIVTGQGVRAMREIAGRHRDGLPFDGIRGIAITKEGETVLTDPAEQVSLDDLPFPDRTLTRKYRKHYFNEWLKPLASIRTSLGCSSRCNFCSLWTITGGQYLKRTPESVVAELAEIQEPNVFFCDDESMCDVLRMEELADLIRSAGISKHYFLYARADTIARHPGLFEKWRDIGLVQVFVGLESFSDERLRSMDKEMSVADQREAVRILDRLGVLLYANFMVDPDFTLQDFKELKRHVRELGLRYASFSVLTPLPGSQLHDKRKGVLLSQNPELIDMIHAVTPTAMPLRDFYRRYYDLYTRALPAGASFMENVRRFGPSGMLKQMKLLAQFRRYILNAHKAYSS